MTDVLAGILESLKADVKILLLTEGRVYGEEMDRDEIPNMPRKSIVVVGTGGAMQTGTSRTINPRFDVWCYGETMYECKVVCRAVYDCLKEIYRVNFSDVRIHSVGLTGGPIPYRDTDTGWPAQIQNISVLADDREQ